jgi:hypothetical protein
VILTVDTNVRRLLYRCVEAARWTCPREARKAAHAMIMLADGDDFNAPAPGMDPQVAIQLAEVVKARGITPELVDALVLDLQRLPVDLLVPREIELTPFDLDAIVTAYTRVLADPQVDGPLVRGDTAHTLSPIIGLLEAALAEA